MAENFVKPIREVGMIISKKINEAREAGKSFDGSRSWDARPEEYVLTVVSCDEDDFKETDGETLFNITKFAYGLTTCSRICSKERCYSYVKKYVEKALGCTDTYMKRFYYSRNLNVPDVVKRLVGADFDMVTRITDVSFISNNLYLKNALGDPYVNYNVLQIQIDNKIKKFIDLGFEPVNDEEEKNAISKAFEEQIKFNELEDELFE